ncbi:HlyD family secretion protein [Terriglobus tenax]|uniref:HlyD family secretion protein n=1 Tax=Terriglobus tenax TaxID=1111115 RepID=UPI0021DF7BF7|nr:HlyD family secretion protein [Terriglobus tenax]
MLRKFGVPVLVLAIAAALALTIQGCWGSWGANRSEQSTDDAYVRTDVTPLSTRVSGTVKEVLVQDYATVTPGQVLVQLQDEDYRAALAQAQAALAAAEASLTANEDAKRVQEEQIRGAETQITAAQAAVTAADAGIAAAKPDVEHANSERARQEALLAARASTRQRVEAVVADAEKAQALLASRQADRARAEAAAKGAQVALAGQQRVLTSLRTKDDVLRADIAAKKAAIQVAEVNLNYTVIRAPLAGTVGERKTHPGQLVAAGMELISLVESSPWIQANFKETQLAHMKAGDPVEVHIDALPDVTLKGHVAQIAPASGSQFALLPPDNATGNFTKVVQRVPVKIQLDPSEQIARLRPGFSATVTVKVK